MNATRLSELVDLTVAVWGAGREGRAAASALTAQGCRIVIAVDVVDSDAEELAARYSAPLVSPADVESRGAEFVVRSPGISKYRDEVEKWRAVGIGSSGLFALWLADQDPRRVVAVTGTKGKSTTVTLLAGVLSAAGHEVHVAGNIGVPVTDIPSTGLAVVEVSSYQAADCSVSPAVAVLTTLGEDHITWHRTVANYHADKLRLFAGSQLHAAVCDGTAATVNALATVAREKVSIGPWQVDGANLVAGESHVDASAVTAQVRRNLAVAANAAVRVDQSISSEHLSAALEVFEPLPSRQREIAVVNGVRWVDDLLASNPTGVAAALESFASIPLVVIMGGADRGIDLAPLVEALSGARNLKSVVLMGDDGDPLVASLVSVSFPVVRIAGHDMATAVAEAARIAEPGDTVTFSPGAPTPAFLGTWQDRSAEFALLVASLGK